MPQIDSTFRHEVAAWVRPARRCACTLLLALITAALCEGRGAPVFELLGILFPSWMLAAGVALLAVAGTRVAMAKTRLVDTGRLQPLVGISAGVICGVLTWLWFER